MRSDELDPALAALSALSQAAHQSHDAHPLYSHDQLESFAQLSASFAPPAPRPPAVASTSSASPSQANIPVESEEDESDAAIPVASTSTTAVPAPAPAASTSAPTPTNKRKLRSLVPSAPPPSGFKRPVPDNCTPAEKAALRKERNRIAAQKSRDKRQAEFDLIVADRDKWRIKGMRLEQENAQLKQSFAKRLREARAEWEASLQTQSSVPAPDEPMPPEVRPPLSLSLLAARRGLRADPRPASLCAEPQLLLIPLSSLPLCTPLALPLRSLCRTTLCNSSCLLALSSPSS